MMTRKLIWLTIMMLIVAACLISVPALSGENPWDADGGNGNGGTGSPLDSTLLDAGGVNSSAQSRITVVPSGGGNNREPNLITRVTVRVSSYIISYFQKGILKKAPKNSFGY